jgi:hypothetical protein
MNPKAVYALRKLLPKENFLASVFYKSKTDSKILGGLAAAVNLICARAEGHPARLSLFFFLLGWELIFLGVTHLIGPIHAALSKGAA